MCYYHSYHLPVSREEAAHVFTDPLASNESWKRGYLALAAAAAMVGTKQTIIR